MVARFVAPSYTRAVDNDSLSMFNRAQEQGGDVDACGWDGRNALHRAVYDGKIAWVKRVLEAGADPNLPVAHATGRPISQDAGDRPVHLALSANCPEAMRLLIDHGADLTLPNGQGQSLAEFAATCDPIVHPLAQQAQVWSETRALQTVLAHDEFSAELETAPVRSRL